MVDEEEEEEDDVVLEAAVPIGRRKFNCKVNI